MTRMPDFEAEAARAVGWVEHHLPHRHPQTPAPGPVTLAAAPAQETRMSIATDVEQGYAAVKNELGKFEAALPGMLDQAKKLEGNPLAQVAIKAAEHVIAGVLPAEAVTYLAANLGSALEGLLALYNPQQPAQATPAAPAQPVVPAGQ